MNFTIVTNINPKTLYQTQTQEKQKRKKRTLLVPNQNVILFLIFEYKNFTFKQ